MNRRLFFILFFIVPCKLFSQDSIMSIQQVIEITLKNNYDIQIAGNENQQAENNNTAGNAGMLPEVDADGSYTRSTNSIKQEYNTGSEVNRDASLTTSLIGDAGATWVIFDGLRMFSTKEKLSQLSLQSGSQLKIQIENTLLDIVSTYYSAVRNLQLLKAMREEIRLSDERLKIADRKMNNGSGSRLDWLQAKTEYNRQRAQEITLQSQAEESRIRLNQLMGRQIDINFSVEDTVIITYKPVFEELKKSVSAQNNTLNFYRINQRIAELGLKETKSQRWPIIGVNAHYVFSKNTNEAGLILLNQSQGFNYGVTATLPLFHGLNISRQIKNSRLDLANAQLTLESANSQVNSDLYNAWREFGNNLELLKIEEENIGFAREVLSIAQERYKVGVSNSVELQEALQTFEDAMTRLANARYNAKISETTLKRLNGELVK